MLDAVGVQGVMVFGNEAGRVLEEEDRRCAEELARRAGTAVTNARVFRERTEIAAALQHSLLPPRLPHIPGVSIAASYTTAGEGVQVGGDFYDAFPAAGRWVLVIGDVRGRG
jgi:phosphoserine phosphatase RsbU/P